jgi:hypothetical protein
MPFTVTNFKVATSDGRNFVLLEPVDYFTDIHCHLEQIVLPAGTESDGASIPPECWALPGFQPFGTHWRSAYVHDYLYRHTNWSREDCDAVLLEAMQNLGVDALHAAAIYRAVREFGQSAFDRDRAGK